MVLAISVLCFRCFPCEGDSEVYLSNIGHDKIEHLIVYHETIRRCAQCGKNVILFARNVLLAYKLNFILQNIILLKLLFMLYNQNTIFYVCIIILFRVIFILYTKDSLP